MILTKTHLPPARRITAYRGIRRMIRNNHRDSIALSKLSAAVAKQRPAESRLLAKAAARCVEFSSLSQALKPYLPHDEFLVLSAHEGRGSVVEGCTDAIALVETKTRMSKAVIDAFRYPILLFLAVNALLNGFAFFIIPELVAAVEDKSFTGMAYALVALTTAVQYGGVPLLLVATIAAIQVIRGLPTWTSPFRRALDSIPPWSLYRLLQGASFMIATATLLNAGDPIQRIPDKLLTEAKPWLRQRLLALKPHVEQGVPLGPALDRIGYGFPDHSVIADLTAYSDQAGLADAIRDVTRDWLEEKVAELEAFSKRMFVYGLLGIASILGFIMLGMYFLVQQLT